MATSEDVKSDNPPDSLTRVEDLWFPDASLVLQASNRLFRVSGGLLCARSPVFRDILSIPQPENEPTIEGCPVVILHDSPDDTEYFLRAVFDSGFFERPPAPASFNVVAGILRLSLKYDVEYLQQRAILHLSAALPHTLADYDARAPGSPFGARNSEFALLTLVHELGPIWALPMAMYFACCLPVNALLDGIPFDGYTTHLSPSLQRTLLIARSTLAISQTHTVLRCLRSLPCEECASRDLCLVKSRHAHDAFTGIKGVNPLDVMDPAVWTTLTPILCAACYRAAKTEHQAAREKVWAELPSVFGLKPWEEDSTDPQT
ncbi:hypothetical protein DFH06DRAFT_1248240 [Mycena polygramma]|nr:hypothetical protein DFH06DRAFT_1248240 [Mycena polygramma]